MKYCGKCGTALVDEANVCSSCGTPTGTGSANANAFQNNGYAPANINTAKPESGVTTAAKILLIIGAVITSFSTFLIGLAWCIPMCIHYFNCVKYNRPVSIGYKICTLLFVSQIAGIIMLVDQDH